MATFYLDLANGNDASAGTSWGTAWKTFSNGPTAARIAPGDTIRVAKTSDPVSIGNATWTSRSATVTLATAQTATIDNCETSWTAANSGTAVRQTTSPVKQGTYWMALQTPASTLTATKYAYFTVGGASGLDLSAHQQITLWIWLGSSATADANRYQIKLCSDTTGDTAVDVFNIPAIPVTGAWVPIVITKNGGGNLGSAIKSIAWYTGSSSPGNSQSVRLDNISACKTNGLNLTSLISKNSTADYTQTDGWWAIGVLDNTTVTLANLNSTTVGSYRGYYTEGTSPETVTTYMRGAYNGFTMTSSGSNVQNINDSGTAGNLITYSGGWDTSTNTRTGITFIDGQNGLGYMISLAARSYNRFEYFGFTRCERGFFESSTPTGNVYQYIYGTAVNTPIYCNGFNTTVDSVFGAAAIFDNGFAGTTLTISNMNMYSGIGNGVICSMPYNTFSTIYSSNNSGAGINASSSLMTFSGIVTKYNATDGFIFNTLLGQAVNVTSTNNTTNGLRLGYSNTVNGYTSSGNAVSVMTAFANVGKINNWTYSEATPVSFTSGTNGAIITADYINGSPVGAYYASFANVSTPTFTSIQQSTTTKTGLGYAWQTNVLNTIHAAAYPAKLTVASIAVNANKLVTVKAWVKLSHATNISAALVVPRLTIQGVSSDVKANKTADTNWEELTVTFTPTVTGVANIELWTWSTTGSTTNSSYIDNMTITQA
jgi:hypothetical protein